MTSSFAWREPYFLGGEIVSPEFATPEEAGEWRREHPPLTDFGSKLVVIDDDGFRRPPTSSELTGAFVVAFG